MDSIEKKNNVKMLDYSKIDKQIIIATNGHIHNEFEKIINLKQ